MGQHSLNSVQLQRKLEVPAVTVWSLLPEPEVTVAQAAPRPRLRRAVGYVRRYLPAELAGTVLALGAATAAHEVTGSLVAAALWGTIGENVGYYGTMAVREARRSWRAIPARHQRGRRAVLAGWLSVRAMLVEFGPAEVADSFVVRPGLLYLMPTVLTTSLAVSLLIGKVLADIVFYGFAISGYELRKRLFGEIA